MTTSAKLAIFAIGVAAVFGIGAVVGAAVGPIGDVAPPGHSVHRDTGPSPTDPVASTLGP